MTESITGESVADIVAELRDATMNGEYDDDTVNDWADRIEAAWKREKSGIYAMLDNSLARQRKGGAK